MKGHLLAQAELIGLYQRKKLNELKQVAESAADQPSSIF